jgi:hypothetical protein
VKGDLVVGSGVFTICASIMNGGTLGRRWVGWWGFRHLCVHNERRLWSGVGVSPSVHPS